MKSISTNKNTTVTPLDTENVFEGVTQFDYDYSLKGMTQFDEMIVMEDMLLIKGTTLYKEDSLDEEEDPLKGITIIREIVIKNGKVFLKGTTYINDDRPEEGVTQIKLTDFNKVYPLDVDDLIRCIK